MASANFLAGLAGFASGLEGGLEKSRARAEQIRQYEKDFEQRASIAAFEQRMAEAANDRADEAADQQRRIYNFMYNNETGMEMDFQTPDGKTVRQKVPMSAAIEMLKNRDAAMTGKTAYEINGQTYLLTPAEFLANQRQLDSIERDQERAVMSSFLDLAKLTAPVNELGNPLPPSKAQLEDVYNYVTERFGKPKGFNFPGFLDQAFDINGRLKPGALNQIVGGMGLMSPSGPGPVTDPVLSAEASYLQRQQGALPGASSPIDPSMIPPANAPVRSVGGIPFAPPPQYLQVPGPFAGRVATTPYNIPSAPVGPNPALFPDQYDIGTISGGGRPRTYR